MKNIDRNMLQWIGTKILISLARIFWVFPIRKNKILFISFSGKQYSCSPKYISEYLEHKYPSQLEIIWALRFPETVEKDTIKKVKFLSLKHFYHFCTSKVIVDNGGMPTYMPKRKKQYVINTWHGGGAYKANNPKNIAASQYRLKLDLRKSSYTDLVLSSSRVFSECVIPDIVYQYSGEIMPCGLPRNDILCNNKDKSNIRNKVCHFLGLKGDEVIVLYAPTYRGAFNVFKGKGDHVLTNNLDIDSLIKALENKMSKKVICLERSHHASALDSVNRSAINVTVYPDMQELLCAADILISDYSSTIWDFSLMKKPCFLYCPDLDYYLKEDRSTYTPVETWPGILCRSNEELEQAILNFDEEEYVKKVEQHHADLGSYETGTACKQVCDRIYEVCYGEKPKEEN